MVSLLIANETRMPELQVFCEGSCIIDHHSPSILDFSDKDIKVQHISKKTGKMSVNF